MPDSTSPLPLTAFQTLGDLLKFLRRRAGLSQRELSIAVGYSESQISRLERNRRPPDLASLAARFAPALNIQDDPATLARMLALAAQARGEPAPVPSTGAPGPEPSAAPTLISVARPDQGARPQAKHNLPLQLTNFIGRTEQIAEVKPLLRATRLLTLVGPGGTGKTRFALQLAEELMAEFPDGAWLVELAPIADPAQVPEAVVRALAIRAEPGQHSGSGPVDYSGREALVLIGEYLQDKQLLLILDNCEHLVAACARLAEQFLRAAPGLSVLATSREALGVAGEVSYPGPALTLPDPEQLPPLEVLAQSEAVRLFVERAAAVRPDFALTLENASAVAQICQRLDGIPLAIELAAACVRALTVEQIAAHLAERDPFGLLTGGNRNAAQRQQTLRGAIDWSYDLLTEPERRLLRWLSVFAGGWTLEAAEHLLADDQRDGQVLGGLTQLVAKSLVMSEQQAGQAARFSMLETIRQYAQEKLAEAGEDTAARQQHLAYGVALAEQAEPELRGPGQRHWLDRLDREHENLRGALAWAMRQEDAEAALRLSGSLTYFWRIRGYAAEGARRLNAALALHERRGAAGPSRWQARAWLSLGWLDLEKNPDASLEPITQALALYQELGDQPGIAYALFWLGRQRMVVARDYAGALLHYEAALQLWLAAEDGWGIGLVLHYMGHAADESGDRARAHALYQRSVELLREAGDQWQLIRPLGDLAWQAWEDGDLAGARAMFEENLAAYEALRSPDGVILMLHNLNLMSTALGDYPRARAEALAILNRPGQPRNAASGEVRLGQVDYLQGRLAEAQAHFEAGLKLFTALNDQNGMGWVPAWLACVAYRRGDLEQARALVEQALAIDDPDGYWPELAFALLVRGDVARAQGEAAAAAGYYRRSLLIVLKHRAQLDVADLLEGFAKLAGAAREPELAARLLGAAAALRARVGTPIPAVEQADYEAAVAQARAQVDAAAFEAAWAEGTALTWEQAAQLALE